MIRSITYFIIVIYNVLITVSKSQKRALQFAQFPWLHEYIELNTNFRTLANNEFEKNLYKLMNNAVFDKIMENVRNHVSVRLVTRWDGRCGAEAMLAKPNFHNRSVFSENLVAIKIHKLEVKFDKPIYVGMCILDISMFVWISPRVHDIAFFSRKL